MDGFVKSDDPISIHTLRMEGDRKQFSGLKPVKISIHTLRMEGDDKKLACGLIADVFQSTPSAWRVTVKRKRIDGTLIDFNPHPPHGG